MCAESERQRRPDIRKHYVETKAVLRKKDLADFFTISKFGFSPYRACEHGCLYCDGRAEKYYIQGEFDKDIVIRKNLPLMLDAELSKIREKGFLCIGSGVSDPYQPVECEELIMRQCAEILLKHSIPVVVMTKSPLILRDLDIWAELNRKSRFLLMVSLTFVDDMQRKIFEPAAGSVQSRLDTLKQFNDAGCSTGVLAMPLLPFITESRENMNQLASIVKSTGADFMIPGGLTLRPGVQKDTFITVINSNFNHLAADYNQIYSENRPSGAPSLFWRKKTSVLYKEMLDISGLPSQIPHQVYRDIVPVYEEVFLLLEEMKNAFGCKGVDTKPLQIASDRYRMWLTENKRPVNRSRKRSYSELEGLLRLVCSNDTISEIISNKKLGNFIKEVVLGRRVFDFRKLMLR